MAPKTKGQQQEAETGARDGGHEVDTDAEHDPDRSRRASNAGLRGEVRVAEVDKKERDHEASGVETYQATAASLRLLAKELREGVVRINEALADARNVDPEHGAGIEPYRQRVEAEFVRISDQADSVLRLVSAMDPSLKQQLAPEVKQVNAAYTNWHGHIHGANVKFGLKPNEAQLMTTIRSLDRTIGFDQPLTGDAEKLEGTEDSLAKSAVTEHIEGVIAAAQSVTDGNTADAKRVTAHVVALAEIAEHHPGAFKKQAKLKKAVKDAKAVAAADAQQAPTITTALKALPAK